MKFRLGQFSLCQLICEVELSQVIFQFELSCITKVCVDARLYHSVRTPALYYRIRTLEIMLALIFLNRKTRSNHRCRYIDLLINIQSLRRYFRRLKCICVGPRTAGVTSFARFFFFLRGSPSARHFNCATFYLRDIPFARHPICATTHLRDFPTARHSICVTSHLRDFFSSCLGPLLVSLA